MSEQLDDSAVWVTGLFGVAHFYPAGEVTALCGNNLGRPPYWSVDEKQPAAACLTCIEALKAQ